MHALVTGWFSFAHGEATAGDLMSARAVSRWLADAGIDHDVAMSPAFPDGVRLDEVDPAGYSHLLFVCGPAFGQQLEGLLSRFRHCVKVAVGVSLVEATPAGFDVVLERDSPTTARSDLSLAAPPGVPPPVVGAVRTHPQPEYRNPRIDHVHRVVDEVLDDAGAAVVEIDTRVEPRLPDRRHVAGIEADLARVDAVVSTRLHGLVLALRHGTPAVAVDAVPGGAKVSRQCAALGWPASLKVDELTPQRLRECLEWVLGGHAKPQVRRSMRRAQGQLDDIRVELLQSLESTGMPWETR